MKLRSARGELVRGGRRPTPRVPNGVALLQFNAAPIYETGASALIDRAVPSVEVDVEKVT